MVLAGLSYVAALSSGAELRIQGYPWQGDQFPSLWESPPGQLLLPLRVSKAASTEERGHAAYYKLSLKDTPLLARVIQPNIMIGCSICGQ
jgi:hypothetical protein